MKKAEFVAHWPGLMKQAQKGDKESYRQLLDEIGPRILWFLKRRVKNDDDTADLYQTAIMQIHAGRHTYDSNKPLEPWLFAITRHVLNRYLKKHRSQRDYVDLIDLIEAQDDVSSERTVESMMAYALEQMTEEQRVAFVLAKIEGLSLEEADKQTGSSIAAIKTRAHRAYKVFKQAVMEM